MNKKIIFLVIGLIISTIFFVKIQSAAASVSVPEGGLIRANNDIDVYIVKYVGTESFKRLILSPTVFNSYQHLHWSDIKVVDQSVVNSFVTSDLVQAVNDTKVYKLTPSGDTGQRQWIETADAFNQLGYHWDAIYQINQTDLNSYTNGPTIKVTPTTTPTTPSVTVISPNGGEIWQVGNTYTIKWPTTGVGASAPTAIYLSMGDTRIPIAETTNTGSYNWTIPATLPSWGNQIKLGAGNIYKIDVDLNFFSTYAPPPPAQPIIKRYTSQGTFSILTSSGQQVTPTPTPITPPAITPSITVLSPNGGENLIDGNTYTISWKSDNAPAGSTVGLRYVKMEEITAWDTGVKWWAESGFSIPFQTPPNLPTTGTFTFVPRIPCDDCGYSYHVDPTFKYYRIKAILFPPGTANYGSSGYAEDFSDTNFTVTMPAGVTRSLKITYPTKDDVLMAGGAAEYPIEWTSSGITAGTNIDINWGDAYGMNPAGIASTKNTNSYNQFGIPNLSWWGTLPQDKNINLAAYDQYGVVIARDVSEPFHIVAPTSSTSQVWNLTLSGPATIKKGTSLTVKWSSYAPTGWAPTMCRMWFDGTQTLINDLPGSGSYSFPTDSLTVGQSYAYRLRCFDTGWVLKNYNYHTVDVPNSEGNALGKSVLISQ